MIKSKKRRNLLILVAALCALAVVGGVWAYYTNISDVDNRLITKGSEVFLKELFNPSDEWVPGETKEKEVSFGNRGELDQVLRFKPTEKWYDNKGTPNNLADDTVWSYTGTYTPAPAVINWTGGGNGPAPADWVKIGDWYYYTKVLSKGTTAAPSITPKVIESVKFSPAISNAGPGAADDFTNKRYSLSIEMESLDVSTLMTEEEWQVKFTQSGNSLTWSAAP